MDMTQFDGHTPGPLACVELMAFAAGFAVEDGEGRTVARIMKAHGAVPLPARANAALFTAAPELLAEVRRLTDEAAALRRERDELKGAADRLSNRAHELECHIESLQDVVSALGEERDELSARLADVEAQQPVHGPTWLTDEQIVRLRKTTRPLPGQWGDTKAFARAIEAWMLHAHQAPASAPVLEVRACGCSQAKAGRCVMGDYGALPIGTQLYAGVAPERAERLSEIERWKRIAENAQAVTTGGNDKLDYFEVPAHLMAALALALDEWPGAQGQAGAAEWPDGFEQAVQSLPTLADAVALFDAPAAEPDHCEDARGMVCATSGRVFGGGDMCHFLRGSSNRCDSPTPCAHQRPRPCRTCRPDGCSDSTSCPRGER